MVSVHPGGRCPESETKAEDARRHVGEIIGWNPAAGRRAWYRPHSAIKPKRDNRRPCEPRANIKRPTDAHCNEKVAFLVAPEVRCTVDVAVSVRSRRGTALSSKVQKVAQHIRGVTLSRLAPGLRRNLYGVVRLLYR